MLNDEWIKKLKCKYDLDFKMEENPAIYDIDMDESEGIYHLRQVAKWN